MKRISAIFVLTPGEQRVVIFLVLGLLAWSWLRQQQEVKRETALSFSSALSGEQ